MSKLITRIKRLALALCFVTPLVSWADAITAVNPVTGETETYTYKFIGTDTWNGTEYWQDSNGANPSAVPAKSGDNTWDPILFDGNTININASMPVEGWNLRLGLYNGANVRLNSFVKWQGDTDMWVTVDGTSKFTVGEFGKGNIADGKVIKCSTTRANGIEWLVNLESTGNANNTFEYYLAGAGSVSYQGVTAANHKIKQADATISGTSQVASKTLVTFTSTDKTFTADAAVVLKDNNGDELKTVYATSVTTADDTTLTGEEDVGTCELVQTTTGIVLYWVDGDPAALAPATVYKPSISINFTDSGNNLTTGADVGLTDYEVPGTSWNNFAGSNGTYGEVKAVADSTGSASVMSGLSVTVSGTRGSWATSLPSSSNPLAGYIDENAGNSAPTVTVTGIPYYKYRVLVYHSTDTANVPFGYDTINGTNYTYVEDALSEGTTAWGNSGPDGSADAIAAGGNVLVTEAISGSTLTVVGHRAGGDSSARGCIAAIQIIEVKADVGENDLEIAVNGETEHTVTAEEAEKTGTVYLTGSGTLTLAGENQISAATINVGDLVTLVVNADRLDATTFTGGGTVVYNNALPVTGKGWTDSAWTGTVWINGKSGVEDFNVNSYGNSSSSVKLSGVDGWVSAPENATYENAVPVILENGTFDYALKLTNGHSPNDNNPVRCTAFVKVSGSGTISDGNAANPMIKIYDASDYTGAITLTRARVVFCSATSTTLPAAYQSGIATASIYVDNGNSVTVPADKTWTAAGGFVVNGTLNANGTLASSHASKAVSGSGTVVFNGKLPSPTGDAWWKNSDWDGTVQIKSTAFTGVSGVATYLEVNKYGNDGSTLELNNCSGWLPVGNTAGDNVCTVPLKVTGTLTINDGYSNRSFTINKLSGSGAIYTTNNGATVTIQVLSADDFTGCVQLNKKRVVFGETIPATYVDGQIYVGSGFSLTVPNSNVAWYGTGGITVDGELRAAALSNLGGGTTITTTDNGVFTLLTASQIDDQSTSYARITGTGTLRYADGGSNNWRALSQTDFPTGMICENNLSAGLILKTAGGDHTIGSLAGSGKVRSDWGSGDRNLKALQAKDTVYSGLFDAGADRVGTFTVAPGASSAGTLTLSGTQTADNDLVIESGAAVNLTGTWVGATTVAGTFGGTGTLTGDLTFSDGATFKANSSALSVSGNVTFPTEDGEAVTVDVTGVTLSSSGTTLVTSTGGTIGSIAKVTASGAILEVESNSLKAYPHVATYGGVKYATFAAAIAAALADEGGEANLASITVVDAAATLPDGYVISDNKVVKAQAAVVDTEGAAHYYATAQAAFDDVDSYLVGTTYDYFAVYYGTDVEISVDPSKMAWTYGANVKVRCLNGSTVSVTLDSDEYVLNPGEPEDGIVTYSKTAAATTYVWVGATSDEGTSSEKQWSRPSNWRVGTSDGATASRSPSSIDTANLIAGAYVTGISVSDSLTITGSGTLTSANGISLTTSDATLVVTGVTLSPAPTTTVENSEIVMATGAGNEAIYSVVEQPTVTVTTPVNGTIVVTQGEATVTSGSRVSTLTPVVITITPAENYEIDDDSEDLAITMDGVDITEDIDKEEVGTVVTATIPSVTGDLSITIPFKLSVKTFTVTIPDNTEISVQGATLVEGNTYTAQIGAEVTITYTAVGNYVVKGGSQTIEVTAGTETVNKPEGMTVNPAVAQIEGGAKFEDLAEAIGEAGAGDIVTLLADVALANMIDVDKEVTIDLNGNTVSIGTWANAPAEDALFCVKRGGNLTVTATNGGAIIATSNPEKVYSAIKMTKTGEAATGDAATLTVNSGTITGYYYAITGQGQRHGTVITINGGALSGVCEGDNLAIFHPQTGTLTVTGGTLSGTSGIEMRAGTLTVTGGTITATGAEYSYSPKGSGSTTKGAAVAIAQHTTKRAITATVTGGTLTGVKQISVQDANNDMSDITVQVSEANIVSTIVPEGYRWSDPVEGICTLEVIPETPVIDPDSDEPVEVPVDKNADEADAQAAADAIPVKTTTEIEEILDDVVPTTPGKTAQEEYQANFKRVVAQDDDGNWVVTETTIKEEVVEEASDEVLDALEEVTATDDEITIVAKPGLQYGLVAGDDLGTVNSGTPQTMIRAGADGKVTLTIPQIEGEDIMFFKLVISQ